MQRRSKIKARKLSVSFALYSFQNKVLFVFYANFLFLLPHINIVRHSLKIQIVRKIFLVEAFRGQHPKNLNLSDGLKHRKRSASLKIKSREVQTRSNDRQD